MRPSSGLLPGLALVAAATFWAAPMRAQDAEGKEIFLDKCAKCHGDNGVPRRIAKGAPNFIDPKWTVTLEQIEHSVREGKGPDMKPFRAKLDPREIRSVALFVQSLRAALGQAPKKDETKGQEVK